MGTQACFAFFAILAVLSVSAEIDPKTPNVIQEAGVAAVNAKAENATKSVAPSPPAIGSAAGTEEPEVVFVPVIPLSERDAQMWGESWGRRSSSSWGSSWGGGYGGFRGRSWGRRSSRSWGSSWGSFRRLSAADVPPAESAADVPPSEKSNAAATPEIVYVPVDAHMLAAGPRVPPPYVPMPAPEVLVPVRPSFGYYPEERDVQRVYMGSDPRFGPRYCDYTSRGIVCVA